MTFALSSLQVLAHEQIVIQLAKPSYNDAAKNQYIHDILSLIKKHFLCPPIL